MSKARPKIVVYHEYLRGWVWRMNIGRRHVESHCGWERRAQAFADGEAIRDAMARAEVVEEKR